MKTFVRLKNRKGGPITYTVYGVHFTAGIWTRIYDRIVYDGKEVDLKSYLSAIRLNDMDPDSPLAFDITDEAGAKALEGRESEQAEREAAARLAPTKNQVERAGVAPGMIPAPGPAVNKPIPEIPFGDEDDEEEGESGETEGSSENNEDDKDGTEEDPPMSNRRAARLAKAKAAVDANKAKA